MVHPVVGIERIGVETPSGVHHRRILQCGNRLAQESAQRVLIFRMNQALPVARLNGQAFPVPTDLQDALGWVHRKAIPPGAGYVRGENGKSFRFKQTPVTRLQMEDGMPRGTHDRSKLG